MSPREIHQARRLALQVLCVIDVQGADGWHTIGRFMGEQPDSEPVRNRAAELARATFEKRTVWDESIVGVSHRWDLSRMGLVDRNLLRLALFEMSQPELTPVRVAIDEAIELAKEFGAAESPAFVNGVLDAVWRKSQPAEEAPVEPPADLAG
ncbi:MAG: transcription antitermination factor NusB [Phycisphaerae bacterium]|nr:transcription antitermination factor NusB [Phycisphaerae bacterium]